MSAAMKVGLLAIYAGGFAASPGVFVVSPERSVASRDASVAEPIAVNTPGPQAPKELLCLTPAALYKHTSPGPGGTCSAPGENEAGYERIA